jgi:hypothetical protein
MSLTRLLLKLSKAAAERNVSHCAWFQFQIGMESPDYLIFIDESRIDCRMTYRLYGWVHKGSCACVSAKFVHGQGCMLSTVLEHCLTTFRRYSILPAISHDGIIYSDVCGGTYDGDMCLNFIEDLMPHMNPWPTPCSVLVMDNCTIHHIPRVVTICGAR